MMFFEILTLFPGMFDGVFSDSIIKRAIDKKLVSIDIHDIRDYSLDRHKCVDDYPYGGDPGMLLKPEPLYGAISDVKKIQSGRGKVVFLSPHGCRLNHDLAQELSKEDGLILVCGRYKGIDQRIRDNFVDLEISVGDYVLSGGEIPAMALVDTVTRLIPGVLGNKESVGVDSFYNGLLSPPQYTRPEIFEGFSVPSVLLSGNHKKIADWQKKKSEELTRIKRPDLWEKYIKRDVNK